MREIKVKKNEFLRCVKNIPNEAHIKSGSLYSIEFFLHKESHMMIKEINWFKRDLYWLYLKDERGKTWKYDFKYFSINIKLIRKEKILNLFKDEKIN